MFQIDTIPFFRAWLNAPMRVASVVPSGPALARLISAEITPGTGPVLELGPGTGVFTQALIDRGVRVRDLTLVEYGPEFIPMLQARFPEAKILQMDAARLRNSELLQGRPFGAVVSGLPLLSMSGKQVMAIMAGAFSHLQPGGAFYQFTYGPRCPIPRVILDRLDLKACRIGKTYNNLPPAAVYRITRRGPLGAYGQPH